MTAIKFTGLQSDQQWSCTFEKPTTSVKFDVIRDEEVVDTISVDSKSTVSLQAHPNDEWSFETDEVPDQIHEAIAAGVAEIV